jgi:hypothetical protein
VPRNVTTNAFVTPCHTAATPSTSIKKSDGTGS